jgi:hypothetical protein
LLESNKEKGRMGLALAISYFTFCGYTVSTPLNDTQWYDLIIEKNGRLETVQCKFTGSKDNSINLKQCGGTSGKAYDSILNHKNLDWLFCADLNMNMYLIPVKDIFASKNTKSIKLNCFPNSNGRGFQTYLYKVEIPNLLV